MKKNLVAAGVAIAAASAIATAPMAAQSMLRGMVMGIRSENRLSNAHVAIDSLKLHAKTDSSGAFTLGGVPAGAHLVTVRRDGFAILDTTLTFSGSDTLAAQFILASASDTLDPTQLKMADFERRRARSSGWFLTRADLTDLYDRQLSEVLSRRIPGIRLVRNARGDGVAVASGRGPASQSELSSGDGFAPACYAQVFVDGIRVFATGAGGPPVSINEWRTSDIEGIEFYPPLQQTPPEYVGTGALCGTIALWLRVQ